MTDQRLQALSRAARLDPAREPELLRERVRAGDLTPERLELAAYCGHEAARKAAGHGCCPRHQALGRDPQEGALARLLCSESPLSVHDPLPAWVRGLSRWGAETQVRAAVAACEAAWGEWKGSRYCLCMGSNINPPWRLCPNCGGTGDHDPRPRYALHAARGWLVCPCEGHRIACREIHDGDVGRTSGPWRFLLSLVCVVADPRRYVPGWAEADLDRAVTMAVSLTTTEAVRTAICRDVSTWALGGRA